MRKHGGAVSGLGEWTRPSVPDALADLRARGFKKVVYFPWGFTTDNAETMLEGRLALRSMRDPFEHVEYLACMNTYPGFIQLLADRVQEVTRGAPRLDTSPPPAAMPS